MKLRFKHQKFQAEAAKAVVDVFAGQPYLTPTYMIDSGNSIQAEFSRDGWGNAKIVPALTDDKILDNIRKIQQSSMIAPSPKLEGHYNLTIEMETGVGKTYTYIKTMFELNKHYGWSKFIVVVPSIAIREGVYKSFEITQEHFAEEYGKKIRFFIYDSKQLSKIDSFASDSAINVMIINSQAFNAKGADARRIKMKLDEFRSRRPIDVIAKTNPILIIDEPQSVEGKQTKENLQSFNPLMTLRYSATHKKDSIYNMIYRLDAMEAYNKQLVKKIAVKGISEVGSTATDGYVYLQSINLSDSKNPTATIQFDCKSATGIKKVTRTVGQRFNLYDNSKGLEEYKNGYVVNFIDGRDDSIEFLNGKKLLAGQVMGKVSEEQLRRLQIRETILSHIERERELFHKGIKVLSLFFIDEVEHYKKYVNGQAENGIFAKMFEEEYEDVFRGFQPNFDEIDYLEYLKKIPAHSTHAGYFSIDKKSGHITNSKVTNKTEKTTDDVDAFDLIMKNKELLLERNPIKSPVRFIFSHSALREGWDNPNVFQICTLKQSNSEVRKRQEVGRGLRLCVNQDGERMDAAFLGADVHNVNMLTVIASESYDSFTRALQTELAEAVGDRPVAVNIDLFNGRVIKDKEGNESSIDKDLAESIVYEMTKNSYIDKKGILSDKYYEDKANGKLQLGEDAEPFKESVVSILDSVYNPALLKPVDPRSGNVECKIDESKLAMPEFKALWKNINSKSFYVVDFDTNELVKKAIESLNKNLIVPKIYFTVETGVMNKITSKEDLAAGKNFVREETANYNGFKKIKPNSSVKYDLVGKIVEETNLTRKDVVSILTGIHESVFNQFKDNPEEFIIKASRLINNEKATAIIEHITYNILNEKYDTNIFTEPKLKGKLGLNAMKAEKNLYDHIIYDSANEQQFAEKLDTDKDVAVYVKLPNGFYISTPVGKYNPDWAIAFKEGDVKHIYFIAETKGSMESMELRGIEQSKIHCAKEHFKAISGANVTYDVVDDYDSLMNVIRA